MNNKASLWIECLMSGDLSAHGMERIINDLSVVGKQKLSFIGREEEDQTTTIQPWGSSETGEESILSIIGDRDIGVMR